MELNFDLFMWLTYNDILTEKVVHYEPKKFIDSSLSQKITSGFIFGKILEKLNQKLKNVEILEEDLAQIVDSMNGMNIINNWNLIFKISEQNFSIIIDQKMKELVTNGDIFMVSEMFNIFMDKYAYPDPKFQEEIKNVKKGNQHHPS